jgi:hypothetical protein
LAQRGAARESALACALNGGTVGARVRERDADLDQVGSVLGEREDELAGRLEIGISARDERDEGALSCRAQRREGLGDAAHADFRFARISRT